MQMQQAQTQQEGEDQKLRATGGVEASDVPVRPTSGGVRRFIPEADYIKISKHASISGLTYSLRARRGGRPRTSPIDSFGTAPENNESTPRPHSRNDICIHEQFVETNKDYVHDECLVSRASTFVQIQPRTKLAHVQFVGCATEGKYRESIVMRITASSKGRQRARASAVRKHDDQSALLSCFRSTLIFYTDLYKVYAQVAPVQGWLERPNLRLHSRPPIFAPLCAGLAIKLIYYTVDFYYNVYSLWRAFIVALAKVRIDSIEAPSPAFSSRKALCGGACASKINSPFVDSSAVENTRG
ncbi:hypothetical protein EVAR_15770_1 [Eumeta japonica]|uniref:Uncharacterized protein n=1 Tax=Eumeta variegata TaxID=151549 RepID=A0A4C1TZD4_EUMVA|nr:hypothetical protein EVAR_15770_1 [Eumeta japonica]